MFNKLLPYLIVVAVLLGSCLIPMLIARFAGVTNKWALVAIGTSVPVFLGAFFASAGSAMATAVSPNEALIKGACYGLIGGLVCSIIAANSIFR